MEQGASSITATSTTTKEVTRENPMSTLSNDITRLDLWGKTHADIAEIMSSLTTWPILVDVVIAWLFEEGLLIRNQVTQSFTGSLAHLMTDEGPFKAGMVKFVNHVWNPRSLTIATHQPPYAVDAARLLNNLVLASEITSNQRTAFYAKDGGLLHPDGVTVEQVAAARAERDAVAVRLELEQYFVTIYHNTIMDGIQDDTLTTTAEIDAAIVAIAGGQ